MSRIPLYRKQKRPKSGRSATMNRRSKFRHRSTADANRRPDPYSRAKCWVKSHRRNGRPVRGHYRNLRQKNAWCINSQGILVLFTNSQSSVDSIYSTCHWYHVNSIPTQSIYRIFHHVLCFTCSCLHLYSQESLYDVGFHIHSSIDSFRLCLGFLYHTSSPNSSHTSINFKI